MNNMIKALNQGLFPTLGGNYALFVQCGNGVDVIIYVSPSGNYLSHDTNWWWEPRGNSVDIPVKITTFPKEISIQANGEIYLFEEDNEVFITSNEEWQSFFKQAI